MNTTAGTGQTLMTQEEALMEVRLNAGTQFNPAVVEMRRLSASGISEQLIHCAPHALANSTAEGAQ